MIDDLRDKIREIDEELLRLMIERIETAEEIGRLKNDLGLVIRDREVEKMVTERYRKASEGTLLDPVSAEMISRILIQNSVEAQAALPKICTRKRICVIGGEGKMGKWISKVLSRSGHDVGIIDVGDDIRRASEYEVVIISIPISSVRDVLKILDEVCDEQLIFDISSLKTPMLDVLRDMGSRKKVCSVHPMFGPSARSMYDRNVIICNCGNDNAVREVMELIGGHGENFKEIDVAEHDRYMSYVLGLSHAVNIAFFTTLERSGIPFKDIVGTASTTFRKNIDTNRSVALEDPRLYYEIQHMNGSSSSVWDEFSNSVEDIRDASLDDDAEKFIMLMKKGKKYFDEMDL